MILGKAAETRTDGAKELAKKAAALLEERTSAVKARYEENGWDFNF